jgi:predicted ATPase
VSTDVSPLLLVVATRPLSVTVPSQYERLDRAPGTHRMVLDSMAPEETLNLICQRHGVYVLPEQVATLIVDKVQGNPFFSEEIAYALRDTEQIQVVDGECVLNPGLGDLHSLDFPDTVEGVITSRIDRLPPQGQLALKVASVIGRIFASNIFSDVCPIEEDRHLLR